MSQRRIRPHPLEYAFGPVADEWFGAIASAAGGVPVAALDIARFAQLAPVEQILEDMRPEMTADATAEAGDEYLRLLYASCRFWLEGRHTAELPGARLEHLLAESARPAAASAPASAGRATYVRLPERSVWAQVGPGMPHEPVDGLLAMPAGGDRGEWLVVAILGFRPDRGGFSQVSATALSKDLFAARPSRLPPLAPVMEGGQAAGFHSITTVEELLLLARLALVSAEQ